MYNGLLPSLRITCTRGVRLFVSVSTVWMTENAASPEIDNSAKPIRMLHMCFLLRNKRELGKRRIFDEGSIYSILGLYLCYSWAEPGTDDFFGRHFWLPYRFLYGKTPFSFCFCTARLRFRFDYVNPSSIVLFRAISPERALKMINQEGHSRSLSR